MLSAKNNVVGEIVSIGKDAFFSPPRFPPAFLSSAFRRRTYEVKTSKATSFTDVNPGSLRLISRAILIVVARRRDGAIWEKRRRALRRQ